MKENARLLLEKAQCAIQAAQTLLAAGNLPDFVTGRVYYAMFYIAEALLEVKKICASANVAACMARLGSITSKPAYLIPNFTAGC